MKYAAILDLRVTHSFYTDGECADLTIEPSAETSRLLVNHRCVLGWSNSGVHVQTALDDATGLPAVPFPSSAVLRFHLALQNVDFAVFTDLTAVNALSSPLFTNGAPAGGDPGELTLVQGSAARPIGVFAEVEVHLDGWGFGGGGVPEFLVAFEARQWRWAYYCVTDLVPNPDDLTIVDSSPPGTPDVLVFSAGNTTQLHLNPDPNDPVGVQLTGRYPTMRCLRMLSDDLVTCREEPRKYLELWHGIDRLAGPLPNPPVRRPSRINTPGQPQDLLFQIVKYRSNPI